MLIKSRKPSDLRESAVTPEGLYMNRRELGLKLAAGAAFLGTAGVGTQAAADTDGTLDYRPGTLPEGEQLTPYDAVTGYNNYYEFGTGKSDPARNAHTLRPAPWSVSVEGDCENPGTYAVEDLVDFNALEERIYRLRCVEAWSMVIPWVGVPLSRVIKKLGPTSDAKYIAFETLADRDQMPGLRSPVLKWPYREGLRLDEALHPLALMAVGLYGKVLPNQNGAPMRLVVPWKYGFKSIKSIVKIRFQSRRPKTSWNMSAPGEYGFYSNVNPRVDHPRWDQSKERRIGDFLKRPTLMFNGYEEEVASLYAGLNLRQNY